MATQIIMPKQGLQMTEGTITRWLKVVGDTVREGEPLFEMETDKLTIIMDSTASGTLLRILREAGETVPVAEAIALVGESGEAVIAGPVPSPDWQGHPRMSPRAKTRALERGVAWETLMGTGPDGMVVERDIPEGVNRSLRASRAAVDTAATRGVDLSAVTEGSGLGGIVTVRDVEAAAPQTRTLSLTGMRRAIWENMARSVHEMAQARHEIAIDMTRAIEIRRVLKAGGFPVTYNDLLLLALSRALKHFPALNAHVRGDTVRLLDAVNIGVAVALVEGLVVPTVFGVDTMSLAAIHDAATALIQKAREGRLTPDDCTGGTFTLTNLGAYGLDAFTAIINPPQTGILALGRVTDTPVAREGQVVIRPMMRATLTYDHRVIDGAPAARFLMLVKDMLEEPAKML